MPRLERDFSRSRVVRLTRSGWNRRARPPTSPRARECNISRALSPGAIKYRGRKRRVYTGKREKGKKREREREKKKRKSYRHLSANNNRRGGKARARAIETDPLP